MPGGDSNSSSSCGLILDLVGGSLSGKELESRLGWARASTPGSAGHSGTSWRNSAPCCVEDSGPEAGWMLNTARPGWGLCDCTDVYTPPEEPLIELVASPLWDPHSCPSSQHGVGSRGWVSMMKPGIPTAVSASGVGYLPLRLRAPPGRQRTTCFKGAKPSPEHLTWARFTEWLLSRVGTSVLLI